MKIKTLYVFILLLVFPATTFAMEAGLPTQEKDPRGETPPLFSNDLSSDQQNKDDKQEVGGIHITALPTIPQDVLKLIAEYNWEEASSYIVSTINIPYLIQGPNDIDRGKGKRFALSPDNTLFLTATKDHELFGWHNYPRYHIAIWNIKAGKKQKDVSIRSHGPNQSLTDITCIKFNTNNSCAFSNENNQVMVFHPSHNRYFPINKSIDAFIFDNQGHWISCKAKDKTVKVESSAMPPRVLTSSYDRLNAAWLSPSGRYACARYIDNKSYAESRILIWETKSGGSPLWVIEPPVVHHEEHSQVLSTLFIRGINFSADEKYFAIIWQTGEDNPAHLTIYDVDTGLAIQELGKNEDIAHCAFGSNNILYTIQKPKIFRSLEGSFEVAGSEIIKLWNIRTGSIIRELDSSAQAANGATVSAKYITLSKDEKQLIAAYNSTNQIKIFSDLDLIDKEKLKSHVFGKEKLQSSQITFLKILLGQLTHAAKENKQVTLYPQEMMLFSKLPTNVQDIFKKVIRSPYQLSWAEKYIYPRLARLLPTTEE